MKEMIMWDKYDNKYREVVDVEVARGLEADLYEANNIISDYIDTTAKQDKMIELIKTRIFVSSEEHEEILKIQKKHRDKSYEDCTIEYFKKKIIISNYISKCHDLK